MDNATGKPRRVLGIGAAWASLWLAFWALVGAIVGIADPDSIDPGEPMAMLAVFGSMGFLSGLAFGGLLAIRARGSAPMHPSLRRAGGLGILGTAIVQLAYLGHGDQGLLANLQMALLFSLIGGIVTVAWFGLAKVWSRVSLSP
jgi:hypothetical protein